MKLNLKKKYLAAVSGGPDSMALLDKYKDNICCVCHVNYHKREDSDIDTNIVISYCLNNNIPLCILEVDKSMYQDAKVNNFQTLARKIRYDFFVQCSKEYNCSNLLIAHNLNDYLETAIMQQNRNSLNFYYGIKQENTYAKLKIYRPLLKEFKSDLEQYCLDNHITYAIDSSNAQDVYERNRIRKQLATKSRKELLEMFKDFEKRNKAQQILEQRTLSDLKVWENSKYSLETLKGIDLTDALIYLLLKKYNLYRVNHNKIKLVKDFIKSQKSNEKLRLEDGVYLFKKDKHIKVIKDRS